MSSADLRELVDTGLPPVGLNVNQYHRMIEAGILPEGEPMELLDGFLVRKDRSKAGGDPMTVGKDHIWAVQRTARLLRAVEQFGCHIRIQQPVALPPAGEPEPDLSIAIGDEGDYLTDIPRAADVPCVIEVADSSLQRDRVTKKRIYAEGGVRQYIIINLLERVIEVYESPIASEGRYEFEQVLKPGHTVTFDAGKKNQVEISADQLLPPI